MTVRAGDIECKALYYGTILLWSITDDGQEYLNGEWFDSLTWDDTETWNE